MKITQVSLMPTEEAQAAGRPALIPELLAATGARYSRSDEGLDTILSKVDMANPGKSVDNIFKFVDYGHASLMDLVPVAMFLDNISIYAAYHLWSLIATGAGQESSTRYIKFGIDGLLDPDLLGIPQDRQKNWYEAMGKAFDTYHKAVALFEKLSEERPELMGIPKSLIEDTSDAAQKKVARMRRNYAFDRARYFIPVAAATNMMVIMSARGWVELIQNLLSSPLPELNTIGEMAREELALASPRLIKHAAYNEPSAKVQLDEFEDVRERARWNVSVNLEENTAFSRVPASRLYVYEAHLRGNNRFKEALQHRTNRYSLVGSALRRVQVTFAWDAVAMAEIRDLNRHRTGTKYQPLNPVGFYCAIDQIPADRRDMLETLQVLELVGGDSIRTAVENLLAGDHTYIYDTLLGAQFQFEHSTTADKYIYEAELRTGLGAHYRYAKHLRESLHDFYLLKPELKGIILEGSAEPE